MRQKVIPGPGQPEHEAELVEVVESKERWSEFSLSDGSTIRMRQIITEVWRLEDAWDAEGNPQYFIKSAGIMIVNAPDNLKRKVQ